MMNKKYLFTILTVLFCSFLISCDKENDQDLPKNQSSNLKVESLDKTFFEQIKRANELSSKDILWKGYDFTKFPMYFVFRDAEGKAQRGYLVNPSEKVEGAQKLNSEDSKGINVYRYDAGKQKFMELINGENGNGEYELDVPIGNGKYYGQAYDEKGMNRETTEPAVLAIHEVFHLFQMDWDTGSSLQDDKNYPINSDLLPLQILTLEIAKKMPAITNLDDIRKYLAMYVAIRSKEMELDPSKNKLVKNMANWQENGEGTAKYVDYMLGKNLFSDYSKYFESMELSEMQAKEDVRVFFAWGIWYGTGASAVYMLKKLDVDVEAAVKNGKTLFSIAEDFLQLSSSQKDKYLNQAKEEFHWEKIESETRRLLAL